MIEAGLPALLESIASAHPSFRPDKTKYPVISFKLLSRLEDETHDGASGLPAYHYQFTSHAETSIAADTMRNDIITLFRRTNGVMVGGVHVNRVQVTNAFTIGYFPEWKAWQSSVDGMFHAKE